MKMFLSTVATVSVMTFSSVVAFANSPDTSGMTGTTTSTTETETGTATSPSASQKTTTTSKEKMKTTTTMSREQAEKACANDSNKDACIKKYMSNPHTM